MYLYCLNCDVNVTIMWIQFENKNKTEGVVCTIECHFWDEHQTVNAFLTAGSTYEVKLKKKNIINFAILRWTLK